MHILCIHTQKMSIGTNSMAFRHLKHYIEI